MKVAHTPLLHGHSGRRLVASSWFLCVPVFLALSLFFSTFLRCRRGACWNCRVGQPRLPLVTTLSHTLHMSGFHLSTVSFFHLSFLEKANFHLSTDKKAGLSHILPDWARVLFGCKTDFENTNTATNRYTKGGKTGATRHRRYSTSESESEGLSTAERRSTRRRLVVGPRAVVSTSVASRPDVLRWLSSRTREEARWGSASSASA